jgi:hypothetical protein
VVRFDGVDFIATTSPAIMRIFVVIKDARVLCFPLDEIRIHFDSKPHWASHFQYHVPFCNDRNGQRLMYHVRQFGDNIASIWI